MTTLLLLPQTPAQTWTDEELAELLTQMLQSSIGESVALLEDPIEQLQKKDGGAEAYSPSNCFGELMDNDPVLPLTVINIAKGVSKRCLERPEIGLPEPVSEVLYYLAITAGFLHYKSWITSLTPAAIRDGLHQIIQRGWLESRVRQFLIAGQDSLLQAGT